MPIKTMNRIIPNAANWLKLTMNAAKGSIRGPQASCSPWRNAPHPAWPTCRPRTRSISTDMATQIEIRPARPATAAWPILRRLARPSATHALQQPRPPLAGGDPDGAMNSRVLIDLAARSSAPGVETSCIDIAVEETDPAGTVPRPRGPLSTPSSPPASLLPKGTNSTANMSFQERPAGQQL